MLRLEAVGWAISVTGMAALLSGPAAAQADSAAPKKVEVCATCHGLDGMSKLPEAPNLAGQNEIYLIAQLTAFKNGTRNNEMMNVVIKELSDDDIAALAHYYSSIEIKVGKIPGQ